MKGREWYMVKTGSVIINKLLRHKQLNNGVHEFIFLSDDRRSIDMYFDTIGAVFGCSPKDKTIRYVIDWTGSGIPSLNYMYLKTKEWGRKYRGLPPGRCLILIDQRGYIPICRALSMLVMKEWGSSIRIRIERVEKRDEAMTWLMGNDQA
jgi:hypothetical protein